MPKIAERTIEIKNNIDSVFSYVVNMENFGKWFPKVIDIRAENNLAHGQIGKKYMELVKDPIKGNVQMTIEVKESKKNSLFVTHGSYAPLLPQMTVKFSESSPNTTLVHWRMASRNENIVFRLLALPLARIIIGPRTRIGLNNLKYNLENN